MSFGVARQSPGGAIEVDLETDDAGPDGGSLRVEERLDRLGGHVSRRYFREVASGPAVEVQDQPDAGPGAEPALRKDRLHVLAVEGHRRRADKQVAHAKQIEVRALARRQLERGMPIPKGPGLRLRRAVSPAAAQQNQRAREEHPLGQLGHRGEHFLHCSRVVTERRETS